MKVCVPVSEFRGLDSPVYGHFGSAPSFAMVDTGSMEVTSLSNEDQGHVHGSCSPLRALAGAKPDVVVVGGMGAGALRGLRDLGIKVFRCQAGTVKDAVAKLAAGELIEMDIQAACGGHGHGHGHGCHREDVPS